jgi:hypothetical protein
MLRGARQDHIKERQRRKCSEKVHAGNGHTVAKAVRARILQRRKRGIRIDVKRQHLSGTGACCRESENTGPGANISHALTAQVEPSRYSAKYSLLRKTLGWNTVGRTRRWKRAARIVRMLLRLRIR